MAAPKKGRSPSIVKQRRNIIFLDKLYNNWNIRRDLFYKRFYALPLMPKRTVQTTFRFPGFWNGAFAQQLSIKALDAAKKALK